MPQWYFLLYLLIIHIFHWCMHILFIEYVLVVLIGIISPVFPVFSFKFCFYVKPLLCCSSDPISSWGSSKFHLILSCILMRCLCCIRILRIFWKVYSAYNLDAKITNSKSPQDVALTHLVFPSLPAFPYLCHARSPWRHQLEAFYSIFTTEQQDHVKSVEYLRSNFRPIQSLDNRQVFKSAVKDAWLPDLTDSSSGPYGTEASKGRGTETFRWICWLFPYHNDYHNYYIKHCQYRASTLGSKQDKPAPPILFTVPWQSSFSSYFF